MNIKKEDLQKQNKDIEKPQIETKQIKLNDRIEQKQFKILLIFNIGLAILLVILFLLSILQNQDVIRHNKEIKAIAKKTELLGKQQSGFSQDLKKIEVKPFNKEDRVAFFNLEIDQIRKNPFSQEARQYFVDVINVVIDQIPQNDEYLKANRNLESLLDFAVQNFEERKHKDKTIKEVNKDDLKFAFNQIYNKYNSLLVKIEKEK